MSDVLQRILDTEAELIKAGALFELETADLFGQQMQVFRNRVPCLRSLIQGSARFLDKEYIVYGDRRISFQDHFQAVASTAKALHDRYGVRKGDRVAILSANNPEWIVAFWAIISLGAIAVGLNGWWVADEILYALEDSEPKVLVGDAQRLARLRSTCLSVPVVSIESDFEQLWNYDPGAKLSAEPLAEDDPACILYTSGTTGRPKGVLNSHRNVAAVIGIQAFHGLRLLQLRGLPPPSSPALLVTSPLFHVSGLYAGAVIAFAMGIKSVWMPGRFDPVKAMKLIQEERITNWGPMGTVAYRFVNHPDVGDYDLSSISSFGSGGAPMSKELQDRLRELFPAARDTAALGYGLTECTGLATLNFGQELEQKPFSSGRPLPTVQVEIRDHDGRPLGERVDGEVHIRGPIVMLGYWRRPRETAETVLRGGWLRTGDIGRLEDGHLVINTRARDMILRGSENIYPAEIENRLLAHPGVAEVAVVGVENEELGQAVKAIVVTRADTRLHPQELAEWVGRSLAYYKVPAHWEIRTEPLPRNAVGKVLKHLLLGNAHNPFSEE